MRFGGATVVIVLSLLHAWPAAGQTFFGSLRGRVVSARRTVTGAAIELTNQRTGLTAATATNDDGEYLVASLEPGLYRLRVGAPGHRMAERSDIAIGTDGAVTVDIELEIGPVTEHVVVTAGAIERSNGILGVGFSGTDLAAQPTAGRNIFIMGALAPAVLPTGNPIFVRQQDQSNASLISMAGSSRRANTYVIDGVPIVDIQNRATIIPGMEMVEEMRVQLGPYDAEVGRTAGGVFNVSARAGGNRVSGSGVYQTRPDATQAQLFFAAKAGLDKVETSYHLFAGSLGGPLKRGRTFFFASGEGYRIESPRNTVLHLPTAAQRRGDFSQSGVTIFDPLTTRPDPSAPGRFLRDPFPGNQIPASRLNPVAVAMLSHLPQAPAGNALPVAVSVLDEARQFSGKLTQQWTARATTSLTYAYYRSAEPDARFFGGALFANGADPGDGALVRRVNFLALNQSYQLADRSLVQVRYGVNQFLDDNRGADFDPATLGFDARFVNQVPFRKFPSIGVSEYGQGGALLGDRDRQRGEFYAHTLSAAITTLRGRHTVKGGAEYRVTGVDFRNLGGSGYFGFTRDFTAGPDPLTAARGTGDAMASFLLGYPAHGGIYTSSPIDVFIRHAAVFVHDDIRVHPRLTIDAGLRYEFEDGLREVNGRMAVGWAGTTPFPIQVAGTRPDGTPLHLTGGLIYAGVNGAPTHQGRAGRWQPSPRISVAFSLDDRTVLRGGYGIFRAPQQGINTSETGTGTRGYNTSTSLVTTLENRFMPCSGCSLTYPFQGGIAQPSGSAHGVMTGVGGGVEYVDPAAAPGYYHRYSAEIERQWLGARVNLAYAGAAGRNLAVGGSSGSFVNVNQLDPRYLSMGPSLVQPVDNPFFNTPLGVGILAGAQVPAAQLLRPYPQFDAVYAMRSAAARARYDALIAGIARRFEGGSLHANYTLSRQRDNQFGESNFFSEGSAIQDYYDIDAEYGVSVLDTPHRLNIGATIALPYAFSISAAATLQSGFPITISQAANNTGLLAGSQRPNSVPGVDPLLTRDPADAFDTDCSCIRWLNPAAWSEAAPFTLGNAPRADGRVRTPGRRLLDVAVDRAFRIGAGALTLRAELINALNARDFRGPNPQWGSATFGEIRADSGFPRTLQLRARYAW
jgi:hypothetical protein